MFQKAEETLLREEEEKYSLLREALDQSVFERKIIEALIEVAKAEMNYAAAIATRRQKQQNHHHNSKNQNLQEQVEITQQSSIKELESLELVPSVFESTSYPSSSASDQQQSQQLHHIHFLERLLQSENGVGSSVDGLKNGGEKKIKNTAAVSSSLGADDPVLFLTKSSSTAVSMENSISSSSFSPQQHHNQNQHHQQRHQNQGMYLQNYTYPGNHPNNHQSHYHHHHNNNQNGGNRRSRRAHLQYLQQYYIGDTDPSTTANNDNSKSSSSLSSSSCSSSSSSSSTSSSPPPSTLQVHLNTTSSSQPSTSTASTGSTSTLTTLSPHMHHPHPQYYQHTLHDHNLHHHPYQQPTFKNDVKPHHLHPYSSQSYMNIHPPHHHQFSPLSIMNNINNMQSDSNHQLLYNPPYTGGLQQSYGPGGAAAVIIGFNLDGTPIYENRRMRRARQRWESFCLSQVQSHQQPPLGNIGVGGGSAGWSLQDEMLSKTYNNGISSSVAAASVIPVVVSTPPHPHYLQSAGSMAA